MSYATLQKNLENFIKDRNYQVTELERKAGLKKNNIYNILKGISKKPSAELLQAVAEALGVTIQDLYNPSVKISDYLDNNDFTLMEKILKHTIGEIQNLNLQVTEVDLVNIILEIFHYSKPDPIKNLDKKFINWILQQRIQKK